MGISESKKTDELNDANESLKLLRLKMETKGTNGVLNLNGANSNYRKPFNPNSGGGEFDKNLININTNKNTFDINNLNNLNNKNNFGNSNNIGPSSTRNNNPLNNGRVRKGPVEEVKDERPAYNEKGEDIYE